MSRSFYDPVFGWLDLPDVPKEGDITLVSLHVENAKTQAMLRVMHKKTGLLKDEISSLRGRVSIAYIGLAALWALMLAVM